MPSRLLAQPATFEIIPPALVAAGEMRLVLGKHSGRRALAHRCRQSGTM
jgi:2-isopropylmalate synthase